MWGKFSDGVMTEKELAEVVSAATARRLYRQHRRLAEVTQSADSNSADPSQASSTARD